MKKIIALLTCAFLGCVNQTEETADSDTRTKTSSQIQPRPLFVTGKSRADQLKPAPLQTVSGAFQFYYSTAGTPYGSVLIFNTNVGVTAQNFASGNLGGKCVAGATNLNGNSWNSATARLETAASGLTEFYTCDGSNPNEPISATQKYTYDNLPSGTYYWIVLGYDKSRVLTHSSGLEKFTK